MGRNRIAPKPSRWGQTKMRRPATHFTSHTMPPGTPIQRVLHRSRRRDGSSSLLRVGGALLFMFGVLGLAVYGAPRRMSTAGADGNVPTPSMDEGEGVARNREGRSQSKLELIAAGELNLIGIRGGRGGFCNLSEGFRRHRKDPSQFPMFRDLVKAAGCNYKGETLSPPSSLDVVANPSDRSPRLDGL